jgi:hypothetical protein
MAMADDDLMRRELKHWRTFFGRWRRGLSQQGASIAYIRRWLMNRTDLNPDLAKHVSGLSAQFLELGKAIENANARSDSTFQALMSSMAIVESQKAIAQAEEISKLTSLAFFFIPLTLVATIFSMDVVVSCDNNRSSRHPSANHLRETGVRWQAQSMVLGCGVRRCPYRHLSDRLLGPSTVRNKPNRGQHIGSADKRIFPSAKDGFRPC